jgi:hypothetical protein
LFLSPGSATGGTFKLKNNLGSKDKGIAIRSTQKAAINSNAEQSLNMYSFSSH